ncbi:MAG: hypothetical protein ACRC7O_15065 [Fimbriiglobus sp.]
MELLGTPDATTGLNLGKSGPAGAVFTEGFKVADGLEKIDTRPQTKAVKVEAANAVEAAAKAMSGHIRVTWQGESQIYSMSPADVASTKAAAKSAKLPFVGTVNGDRVQMGLDDTVKFTSVTPDYDYNDRIWNFTVYSMSEWRQVSGPKIGVANVNLPGHSGLIDVTNIKPHPTDPGQTYTERFTLREVITVKQGYRQLYVNEPTDILLHGTFNQQAGVTLLMGSGCEKSKTTSVESGMAINAGSTVTVIPRVIDFNSGVERSVTMGKASTDTNFQYFEASTTILETDPLFTGKDVKVEWVIPFVEVTRSFELVTAGGVDFAQSQKEIYGPGYKFTSHELKLLEENRFAQGEIVAQRAGLKPGVTKFWNFGSPLPVISTRLPSDG